MHARPIIPAANTPFFHDPGVCWAGAPESRLDEAPELELAPELVPELAPDDDLLLVVIDEPPTKEEAASDASAASASRAALPVVSLENSDVAELNRDCASVTSERASEAAFVA